MAEDDRRDGVLDDSDEHRESDDPAEDALIRGIWASLGSPPPVEAPGISVESIKERLKRGAARRAGQSMEE
jgi:hypothetical protein